MKTGTITFHASHNCGSMLQAYALQYVLTQKLGQENEIIDFSNKAQQNVYGLINKKLRPGIVKRNIKLLPYLKYIKREREDYEAFKRDHFILSDGFYEKTAQMGKLEEQYDLFIAGGDQIWNTRCADADEAYFLPFVKTKPKIAYAPSLGAKNINEVPDKEKYRLYLSRFQSLCVREPNGKKWLEELTGQEIPIIADPVLLLTPQEWNEALPVEKMDEKFIFCYAFSYDKPHNNIVFQEISRRTGLPVYVINSRQWGLHRLDQYGIKLYEHSGPLTYLKLMKNATIVFSQSFHGTLFASMFEKTFWHFGNQVVADRFDDRASAMLEQIGLTNRFKKIDELLETDLFAPVDYTEARKRMQELRAKGLAYLEESLNAKGVKHGD